MIQYVSLRCNGLIYIVFCIDLHQRNSIYTIIHKRMHLITF